MRKEHCCVFLDNLENKYCSAAVELGQELQLSLNIIRLLLEEGSACVCVWWGLAQNAEMLWVKTCCWLGVSELLYELVCHVSL